HLIVSDLVGSDYAIIELVLQSIISASSVKYLVIRLLCLFRVSI
ncbi:MAG: hypothetical protein ACI85Q_001611, partial [Salibacteraceae bacterium]